ncbi:MAG TPA: hypothetical protein VF067_02820 [Sphingomicrobium sp.]
MADDDIWRKRYFAYTAVRVGGLAIFFLGIAIGFTGLVREGGWPQLGAVIAILGVIDAVFAPRLLKKGWDNEDQQNPPQ